MLVRDSILSTTAQNLLSCRKSKGGQKMRAEKVSERDIKLMDQVLREAYTALAYGGAGVAALLASPDQIIAVAHNTIQETGDLTNHAEMVFSMGSGETFKKWMNQLGIR
jgi:hypothetical protein